VVAAADWVRTGDIGHIDADGHLFITDRLKELIKVKGFQVPPAELESLLMTHASVVDAAVIGRPDVRTGETPVAYVKSRCELDRKNSDHGSQRASSNTRDWATSCFVMQFPKPPPARFCGGHCALRMHSAGRTTHTEVGALAAPIPRRVPGRGSSATVSFCRHADPDKRTFITSSKNPG